MADTYIDALNLTELSTFADTNQFVMFNSEEGKRAKYSDVKTAITKDVQTEVDNLGATLKSVTNGMMIFE